MSEAQQGYVYTLDDPRTGEPRYVGATKNPNLRLHEHKKSPTNSRLEGWLDELGALEMSPHMTLIHVTDIEKLPDAEQEMIRKLSETCELLNSKGSPRYPLDNISQVRMVQKGLYLSIEVVERLEEEENQSGTVERLLREEFGL